MQQRQQQHGEGVDILDFDRNQPSGTGSTELRSPIRTSAFQGPRHAWAVFALVGSIAAASNGSPMASSVPDPWPGRSASRTASTALDHAIAASPDARAWTPDLDRFRSRVSEPSTPWLTTALANTGHGPSSGGGISPALLDRLGLALLTVQPATGGDPTAGGEVPAPGSEGGADSDHLQDDELRVPEEAIPFGAAGSWRQNWFGAATVALQRDGEQYHFGWEAEYFVADFLSMNFGVSGIFFDQPEEEHTNDAVGGNLTLLFRWHFLTRDRWTLYADGGAGLLLTSEEIPEGGTNFNFTPQLGIGMTWAFGDTGRNRVMAGVRWHHISNARTSGVEDNPGRDSVMVYAGVSLPY